MVQYKIGAIYKEAEKAIRYILKRYYKYEKLQNKQFEAIVDSKATKNHMIPQIVERLGILYKEKKYLYLLVIILEEPVPYKDSIINLETEPI